MNEDLFSYSDNESDTANLNGGGGTRDQNHETPRKIHTTFRTTIYIYINSVQVIIAP